HEPPPQPHQKHPPKQPFEEIVVFSWESLLFSSAFFFCVSLSLFFECQSQLTKTINLSAPKANKH
ncbi:MAG: hypothetical protein AAF528_11150, partial [Cyanobacteria bacterium P01_C01_bin.121]